MSEIDRIVVAETDGRYKVFGDLKKCEICGINFSAKQPCVMCSMRINKEKELNRKLTKQEWDELFSWLE